jgi:hypothetical protein
MAAAVYYRRNEVGIKNISVKTNVANNDVARLMYYLHCVCTAIEIEQDAEVRRFTSYDNWAGLSVDEQTVLLRLCYTFSPDILEDKIFFHNETLCTDNLNEFIEISQVRQQFLAAESIVIAGQTREVNKIMVYKAQWMRVYYVQPMRGLAAKLNSLNPPAITHRTPARPTNTSTFRSTSSASIKYQPSNRHHCCCCCDKACAIGTICGILFVLAFAAAFVIYYFVKIKK